MGSIGNYVLKLFCDDVKHKMPEYHIPETFKGSSESYCRIQARTIGWTINRAKHSTSNVGRGWTRCPKCNKVSKGGEK